MPLKQDEYSESVVFESHGLIFERRIVVNVPATFLRGRKRARPYHEEFLKRIKVRSAVPTAF
jgi:hypothetical protein